MTKAHCDILCNEQLDDACDLLYFNMADNMQHMLNKSDNSKLSKNDNSYKDITLTFRVTFNYYFDRRKQPFQHRVTLLDSCCGGN